MRFGNALVWQCRELAAGLQEAGHEVFVLAQRDSPLASWLSESKIPYDASTNLNRITLSEVLHGRKLIADTIRRFQPDVLNPHCPPGHLFLSLYGRRHVPGAVFVRTVGEPRSPKKNIMNRWLHETVADGIIVSCHASQQRYLRAFQFQSDKVRVIYPGFNSEAFKQFSPSGSFRQRHRIDKDSVLLGVIARLSPEKGHRFLLEAFAKIHTDFPKAKLIIAGPDASEQTSDDLAEYSKTLGITDKVIFTGKVDDVREVITELTVGVIPSLRSEAICRVALEYMTWGIPIVATDVNILPEVVRDGVNGWMVPVENVEAMAKALRNALENSVEREKRGVLGKELVNSEFSRAQMVKRTLAFYNEVSVSR